MYIPFDSNTGETYSFEIIQEAIDTGDGIVLKLNKKACLAFAELFTTLANESECSHVRLGYDQNEHQGPGFRIEIIDT